MRSRRRGAYRAAIDGEFQSLLGALQPHMDMGRYGGNIVMLRLGEQSTRTLKRKSRK